MPLRIVIADDHPVVRIGARAIIANSGVGEIVAEADSTDAVLAALEATPCDVLVTDLNMPGGTQPDGLAMLGVIHRRHPGLPIVLLSVTTNIEILRTATSKGVLGLVDKASSLEQLPVAIQSAYHGRSFISASLRERIAEMEAATNTEKRTLSPREAEVLRLLGTGLSVTEIGNQLHRSVTTISRQKGNAMRKLGIANDAELFSYLKREF